MRLLELGAPGASLELGSDEAGAALAYLSGRLGFELYVDAPYELYVRSGDEPIDGIMFVNEWDDPFLIACSEDGARILRSLAISLTFAGSA